MLLLYLNQTNECMTYMNRNSAMKRTVTLSWQIRILYTFRTKAAIYNNYI